MTRQLKTIEQEIIDGIAQVIVATPMSQRMEVLNAMTKAAFASLKAARPNDADQRLVATLVELQARIVARAIELDPPVAALMGRNRQQHGRLGMHVKSTRPARVNRRRTRIVAPSHVAAVLNVPWPAYGKLTAGKPTCRRRG